MLKRQVGVWGALIFLLIFFTTMSFAATKTLDIIIGGDMGVGLQCKSDMDCPDGEFCHEEQYYCVACKVPPYEWTGTECVCPAGTVEKDGKTCVECLTDTDCAGTENYCNTDFNTCQICPAPKIWEDNLCVCPAGMKEQGGGCVCVQENAVYDEETGTCVCDLTEEKCAGVNFNEETCACCPIDKPFYIAGACRSCESVYPDMSLWNATLKKCVCDATKGLYGDVDTGCQKVSCIPDSEPFTAKGAITFCTEHDRYLRLDPMENQIRIAFLDGWNGLHNYDYNQFGCRCFQYNTYNDAPDGGHYTNATIHKIPYAKYNLKYPIYFNISGVGCDSGVYALGAPGAWQHMGVCAGNGSTEANISYAIQTEIEGYKCPIDGGKCSEDNWCYDGIFNEADNICGLPGANENCRCPFGKKKIDGRCDWTCQNGTIIQPDGTCACPKGMKMVNGWCRNPDCNEQGGYTYDADLGKCVCNEDAGYYEDDKGKCTYCYSATDVWNVKTKTCEKKCTEQTYTVASPHYSSQYPTGRWNADTQMCECNENIFFFGKYPNCKRCQSTGTMYNEQTGECICDLKQGFAKPDGSCELCMPSAKPNADGTNCVCRNAKQVMFPSGECLDCSNLTEGLKLHTPYDCGTCPGWFYHGNGGCYKCDTNTWPHHQNVDKEECHRCDNRYWRASDRGCIRCDQNADQGNVEKDECYRCPNRFWIETNASAHLGTCRLCPSGMTRDGATGLCRCPSGQIFRTDTKQCVSCAVSDYFPTTQTASETSCGRKRYFANNQYSYLCSKADQYTYTSKQMCENCSPGVRWFRGSDKMCLSCDFPSATGGSKSECSECSRRYFTGTNSTSGTCSLCISPTRANSAHDGCTGCASGSFWSGDNRCLTCSATTSVFAPADECHKCSNQFATYRTDGKTACYGCNETGASQGGANTTTLAECNRCPGRYLDKNKICRICPAGYSCPRTQNGADAVLCPAGYYCPQGAINPIMCPIGTYRGSTGASDKSHCVQCRAGYYCPTPAQQIACPTGYNCPAGSIAPTLKPGTPDGGGMN